MENLDNKILAPQIFTSRDIREEIVINKDDGSIAISTDVSPVYSYVLYVNKTHLVKKITIKNITEKDIYDLRVSITTDNDLIDPYIESIPILNAKQEIIIRRPSILAHASEMLSFNEMSECLVKVAVIYKNKEIATHSNKVQILAHSEFPGNDVGDFRLLASFVLPNNPAVEKIRQDATSYLKDFTGNPSFDGYQSNEEIRPERVINMAAAIYYAIRKKNIVYSEAPASFNHRQKIRFPDEVLNTRFGTCMDMSLFYVACLEMSGLNPILVITPGHIFAGVWLTDDLSISSEITNDPALIEKKVADGINELIVIECTAMCSGQNCTFDEATAAAREKLSQVEYYIDIALCRKDKIIPLPIRNGETISIESDQNDLSESEDIAVAPSIDISDIDISTVISHPTEMTKFDQWERKLLDFSMHNHLLNTRASSTLIPLLVKDLSDLEDGLASGQEYALIQRPRDWNSHGISAGTFETFNNLYEYADIITDALKQSRIHSWLDESSLSKTLTKLNRASKLSLEENGVSSLYLALGVLKWTDTTKSGAAGKAPHYAPIILVPVDLIRKPANVGYSIKYRDEEILVNRTLLEFLKQQFGMDITGLNPPPQDDNGIDVLKVLTILRKAIMERPNWNIIDCAFISNFSFAQFMMWNDVHSHAEEISRNKIVRALVDGKQYWEYCEYPDFEKIEKEDALVPVQVDASQMRAIKWAASGVSFVLHGPPGTGKSQTITAMIANALSKGQKVLFVAEKMAALNVVYQRLKNIGLENFCLELHSNKAQKSKVLNQLNRRINANFNGYTSGYESNIAQIKQLREKLDAYVNELHKQQSCGMSLRELIDSYESLPDYKETLQIDKRSLRSLTQEDLERQKAQIEKLFVVGSAIKNFENNPLSEVKQTEYSQSLRRDVENFYDEYVAVLDKLQNAGDALAFKLGWKNPIRSTEWHELLDLSHVVTSRSEAVSTINSERLNHIIETTKSKKEADKKFEEYSSVFASKYNESILSADLDSIKLRYTEAQKKFLGKQKAIDAVLAEFQQHIKTAADILMIDTIKNEVLNYKQLKQDKEAHELAERNLWNGNHDLIVECANGLEDAYLLVCTKENELKELLVVNIPENDDDWISGKRCFAQNLCDNSSDLRDWILYQSARAECCSIGLEPLCKLYEAGFEQEDILPIYLRTVYKEIIWTIIDNSQTLNLFSGSSFDYHISQYKQAETEYLTLTKAVLVHSILSNSAYNRDPGSVSSAMVLLKKAISTNGKKVSLRNLFDKIAGLIIDLCPCVLMSPMSVAQYLPLWSCQFDLIIFDEASQVPTAQAIGALARGTNAVIVGDPNQMPPTSFFNSDSTDEENIQLEDLDSILDDCLAIGMPSAYLLWHYRSRHESLIAFSNKNYYDNNMCTFPSVNDREKRVKMCTVNGTYLRSKENKSNRGKNIKEAEAVVKEVKRRFNSPLLHGQTIGVVTFNIKQRDLIKDLIDEECKNDPAFEAWAYPPKTVAKDGKPTDDETEELFVKNLENVQGDERDVILFSIGFGPDENGKVYYNFGPLNQEGGWRRLNVAVSRARQEMIVFSSMTSNMIDTNRSANEGVKQLHDFLEYAETGILGDDISKEDFHARGITLQICKALEDAGYKTQKNVGASSLKIDIAVVNPYDDNEYLLGILLDGDTYKNTKATKDREVSQKSVLEGLGWSIYRIWTMDWWDSKKREIANLLKVVEDCRISAEKKAADPAEKDAGPESEDIVPREIVEEKKERKKKEIGPINSSFEARDRFSVDSKEE